MKSVGMAPLRDQPPGRLLGIPYRGPVPAAPFYSESKGRRHSGTAQHHISNKQCRRSNDAHGFGHSCPAACPCGRWRPSGVLIDVRVGPQVLEDLLPLLLVQHEVHAAAAVPPFEAALGLEEIPAI